MKVNTNQIAYTLVQSLEGKSKEETSEIIKDLVKFLAEKNLLYLWRDIETEIHNVWRKIYGASTVKIVSAHELSDEANKILRKIAQGADIESRVDERILGGAIIRIDEKRIDGSIAGTLRRLKKQLYAQ